MAARFNFQPQIRGVIERYSCISTISANMNSILLARVDIKYKYSLSLVSEKKRNRGGWQHKRYLKEKVSIIVYICDLSYEALENFRRNRVSSNAEKLYTWRQLIVWHWISF